MQRRRLLRNIVIVVLCVLLAAAALYFIPWPTRIDATFYGTLVYTDGTERETGMITVSGWKLDYLFQKDRVDVDIDLPDDYGWSQPENHGSSILRNSWPLFTDVPYLVTDTYLLLDSQNTQSSFAEYAFSTEDGMFIVRNGEHTKAPYLVGCAQENYDTKTVMDYFSVFIDSLN